ncbi:MAG TPA: hypothetical protein VFB00_00105, partial [Terriglobales bacterium]|nr:hypothetical protein [Terriglobales bacterium]
MWERCNYKFDKLRQTRMDGEWLSVIDIGKHHGFRRTTVFKIINKLGIEVRKERSSANAGQAIAYVSQEDYQRIVARLPVRTTLPNGDEDDGDEEQWSVESGVFYLIQL